MLFLALLFRSVALLPGGGWMPPGAGPLGCPLGCPRLGWEYAEGHSRREFRDEKNGESSGNGKRLVPNH